MATVKIAAQTSAGRNSRNVHSPRPSKTSASTAQAIRWPRRGVGLTGAVASIGTMDTTAPHGTRTHGTRTRGQGRREERPEEQDLARRGGTMQSAADDQGRVPDVCA